LPSKVCRYLIMVRRSLTSCRCVWHMPATVAC
jgi:hypothetical protein